MCQIGAQHYFNRTKSKIKGCMFMGNVSEYEDLMKDLENLRKKADGIVLMSTGINRCTDMCVIVRPFTYDVLINDDLIYSFNDIENAKKVYDIIRADISGRVYDGN